MLNVRAVELIHTWFHFGNRQQATQVNKWRFFDDFVYESFENDVQKQALPIGEPSMFYANVYKNEGKDTIQSIAFVLTFVQLKNPIECAERNMNMSNHCSKYYINNSKYL